MRTFALVTSYGLGIHNCIRRLLTADLDHWMLAASSSKRYVQARVRDCETSAASSIMHASLLLQHAVEVVTICVLF
jgi:hypothetical protein